LRPVVNADMSSTIFTAPQYDPAKDKRRNRRIYAIVLVVLVLAVLAWFFRFWPQEHLVNQFFTDLEQKNYDQAYGLWMADKNWKQHPDKYSKYPLNDFVRDWGPSGEWGPIRSHKVEWAGKPKGDASGVIVVVTVNERVDPKANIWVESKDNTLTFSPYATR
jgi:hypothetical protein